jgi:hypothetical protein
MGRATPEAGMRKATRSILRAVYGFALFVTPLPLFVSPASAEVYELRGIRLGIPLSEFQRTTYPDADRKPYDGHTPQMQIVCSDDTAAQKKLGIIDLMTSGPEKAAGITKCAWVDLKDRFHQIDSMLVANVPVQPVFSFIAEAPGSDPRLYLISMSANFRVEERLFGKAGSFQTFLDTYIAKFGPPASKQNHPVQNGFGAVFDNWTFEWRTDESSIWINQGADRDYYAQTVYSHLSLRRLANERVAARTEQPSDNL